MDKTLNKQEVMSMLNNSIDSESLNINGNTTSGTICSQTVGGNSSQFFSAWDYWNNYYYPYIYPSYPVYIQERAKDSSKQAFEIVKMLNDKKKLNIKTVKDFIDIMDLLIKVL